MEKILIINLFFYSGYCLSEGKSLCIFLLVSEVEMSITLDVTFIYFIYSLFFSLSSATLIYFHLRYTYQSHTYRVNLSVCFTLL